MVQNYTTTGRSRSDVQPRDFFAGVRRRRVTVYSVPRSLVLGEVQVCNVVDWASPHVGRPGSGIWAGWRVKGAGEVP
jgi:hypothetical protein